MEPNLRLCEQAHTLDADVLRIYEGAFPTSEREPVERLSALLAQGKMLYHRTLNEQGELLCFTFVSLADTFSFLAYMATDPTRRSGGIGSRHLAALVELLKQRYPHHLGMFFEIEATDPKAAVLTSEERTNRLRRRAFYERAGAQAVCKKGVYLTPHYGDQSGKEWEGELMAFEFKPADACRLDMPASSISQHDLEQVIRTIYLQFYQLPVDHPLVTKVLGYFAECRRCRPQPRQASLSGAHRPTNERSTWFSRLLALLKRLLSR